MKKNAMIKIVASFAFFGILLSIVGTGFIILFGDNGQSNNPRPVYTPEQIAEIQKIIESQSGATSESGSIVIPEVNTPTK